MNGLFMRFPNGKRKSLTLSYDDGVSQDKRLLSIMHRHGLKGTFNLNSGLYSDNESQDSFLKTALQGVCHQRMTKAEATELYMNSGMEIAVHGFTHAIYEHVPDSFCILDLMNDRIHLEKQFNTIVRGMAYPCGCFNDAVVEVAQKLNLAYGRTVISSHNFNLPTDWLRLQPTCHHNDPELMNLAKKFVDDKAQHNARLFYLWGHSYEFDEQNNWDVMENFASYMGGREDIWYATNIDIYNYMHAFEELVFNVNFTRVWNPTSYTIYFEYYGKLFCLSPGEEINLSIA